MAAIVFLVFAVALVVGMPIAMSMQYPAIAGSLLAFLLFYSALKYIPAPTVSLITSLEIVSALVLTPLMLKQTPSSHELAGCAIILAAVVITTVGNAKKTAKAA